MHHHYSSKFLIDTLNLPGFCYSNSEVIRSEKNAAGYYGIEPQGITSDSLFRRMPDKVDQNIYALDGKNTFHGMYIIPAVTHGLKVTLTSTNRWDVTTEEIKTAGRIRIVHR